MVVGIISLVNLLENLGDRDRVSITMEWNFGRKIYMHIYYNILTREKKKKNDQPIRLNLIYNKIRV